MLKRAALARALALDPDILFLMSRPQAWDPISARRLDDLIIELSESMNATIVIVTHELASIFAIGTNSVFLDAETHTMLTVGHPRHLLERCPIERSGAFCAWRAGGSERSCVTPRKAPGNPVADSE